MKKNRMERIIKNNLVGSILNILKKINSDQHYFRPLIMIKVLEILCKNLCPERGVMPLFKCLDNFILQNV